MTVLLRILYSNFLNAFSFSVSDKEKSNRFPMEGSMSYKFGSQTAILITCLAITTGNNGYALSVVDNQRPTPPTNLTAIASNPTTVNLTWTASKDNGGGRVMGYDIYRNGIKIKIDVTGTSFHDTQAQPGTQYHYRVDAFDNATPRNKSRKSNVAIITTPGSPTTKDVAGPTTPTNLTAIISSDNQVYLSWIASTDRGGGAVAGYDVYRNGTKLSANVTGTTYRDTTVTPETTYSYQVDAFDNAVPRNKSRKSTVALVTTTKTRVRQDTVGPTAPRNLRATAVSIDQVNLSWESSTDFGGGKVVGYDIWRDGIKVHANLTDTRFRDTDVQPDTQYSYQVDAFDNASPRNKSIKSNIATVITRANRPPIEDTDPPSSPPNLEGKAISHNKIVLLWTSSRDSGGGIVAGYRIYRNDSPVATVTDTSYSDQNLQANTSYRYQIIAFDDAQPTNNSPRSLLLTLRTLNTPPACSGITIRPSDDANAKIAAHDDGSTFCFTPGTHFLSGPIFPRANDQFIGEPGAILDGGHKITHAFFGAGGRKQRNVTIRGLIVQNFQTVFSNFKTRNAIKAGNFWTIENNEIRNNYDTGVHLGKGTKLRNNHIHHNGRYGITVGPGHKQNIVVDGNEIAYNNSRGLAWTRAGSSKVVGSSIGATGFTWINNWIHHNNGHGLHHDYNVGPNIEIAFNRIESNTGNGIAHEAAWGADIHNNVVINNGQKFRDRSCAHGGQIRLINSSNVTVHNNHVESTEGSNGICLNDFNSHVRDPASTTINKVKILRNTIKLVRSGQTGVTGSNSKRRNLAKNLFDRNTYFLPNPNTGVHWARSITRGEWQAKGQDSNSTFHSW